MSRRARKITVTTKNKPGQFAAEVFAQLLVKWERSQAAPLAPRVPDKPASWPGL